MIDHLKVLAIIPARGGSKGVLRKNIRNLAGKPLIAWTIEAARRSRYVDRVIVSSDDAEIIRVAEQWGCEAPFVRDACLAQDDTPGIAPVLDAVARLPGYDLVVLLQPTSPLREAGDIDACIESCVRAGASSCVSVTSAQSPYWMFTLDENSRMQNVMGVDSLPERRQDLPAVYALNGAVYAIRTESLTKERALVNKKTLGYVMPAERSQDIDTELDLACAEFLIQRKQNGSLP
ncbi:cytidylyltransferase domain-containing protein [Pseudorhodoplanes sp.]|uniref:acylneuraminate cytidylyltransferase family protein n=1 Tax=Pseudorhodoplanes sp. TaxID=1934341 RepID=UPI003D104406